MTIERGIRRLIRREGLLDFEKLLLPREHDEVPLYSRYSSLQFLEPETSASKNRILVLSAVRHLEAVLHFRDTHHHDALVMVSILNCEDLGRDTTEMSLVVPCFWISTSRGDRLLFRLRPATSVAATKVASWLDADGLLNDYEVLENAALDSEVSRLYVARRNDLDLEAIVQRHVSR